MALITLTVYAGALVMFYRWKLAGGWNLEAEVCWSCSRRDQHQHWCPNR